MPDQKNIGSSTAKEEATASPKGRVGQASLHREVENFPETLNYEPAAPG